MAESEVIVKVGVQTGDGDTKIKSLKAQLKEMKNELLGLDEGSDRFKELSKQAGELTDKIGDVNDKVKALASDTKRLDALVGVGSAIAGGFQAAQGAMALFGSDSEKVAKAIQNIIAVQGVLNGVQQVGQFLTAKGIVQDQLAAAWKQTLAARTIIAATAQRVWNLAVSAFPLTLIITGITAVVGALAIFKKSTDASAAGQKALNAAIEEGDKAVAKEEATLKILTTTIASNTSSLRDKKKAIEELNAISPEYLGNITLENIGTQESINNIKEYIASIRTKIELQALEAQLQETISERLSLVRKAQNDELTLNETLRLGNIQAEEDAILQMIHLRQLETKEIITGSAATVAAEVKKKQAVEDTAKSEVETAEEKAKRLKELEDERLAELERARLAELDLDRENYEKYRELITNRKQFLIDEEQRRLDAEFDALEAQIDRENYARDLQEQQEIERNQRRAELVKNYTSSVIGLTESIFTITNNLGKQDEASQLKRAKRQFEIKKKLDMAEAVIDGTKAVLSTFANTPGGIIIKTLAASAAGIFAAAKVAAIGSAKFEGGGSFSNDTGTPNIGGGTEAVGNTTPNINPIQAGSTLLNPEPQKVYVVESDITNTQKKVNVAESLASFG